jgi:spore maturation protein CgeB
MSTKLSVAFYGSSLVSAYWNGAATYYRGLLRALAARGHRITFFEPDAYERQQHRDLADPPWAKVVVYEATQAGVSDALRRGREADVVIKASGVGVYDELLEQAVLEMGSASTRVGFCDVDAPATLERLAGNPADPLLALIPRYDFVFTYGGGLPVMDAYRRLGAKQCRPIYNAADPQSHHPAPADPRFAGALGFMGNRLPDREARVDELFFAAARLSGEQFVLAGNGWEDKPLPANVKRIGHLYTRDHNAFNCSTRAVLNISRSSMASIGFSPATRVFEAAAAGACLITDAWPGLESFFEVGREVLVVHSAAELTELVSSLDGERARQMGKRARERVLAEHSYEQRAVELERLLLDAHDREHFGKVTDFFNNQERAPV